MLHFAKLLANSHRFVAEALDRLLLLRRQDRRALTFLLFLEILQPVLRFLKLGQQLLFLGPEAALRLTLDLLDGRERPLRDATSAQSYELAAAGEVVDGVHEEASVLCHGYGDALAEEVLHPYPHGVGEQIDVGNHHHVDRILRLQEVLGLTSLFRRRRVFRRAVGRFLRIFLFILGPWRPFGECRLDLPMEAGREREWLAGGLEAPHHGDWIRRAPLNARGIHRAASL